ncbi:MAG: PKD domain-containing protein [Candidatus Bipolaricaulaceae bacterium]
MRKAWKFFFLWIWTFLLFGCIGGEPELKAVIRTYPNPPAGPYPLTVRFFGDAPFGKITEWTWTFFRLDDGEEIPLGSALSGSVIEYTFEARGKYRVFLTVFTEDQRFAQSYVDIDVRSIPPVATFTADPYPEVQAGKTVAFDAQNSFDPDGAIVSYLWNFGDGSWAETAESRTTHKYDTPGEYWVQLVVVDDYTDRSEPAILRLRVVPKGCGSCP